jgi:hypothetical protein
MSLTNPVYREINKIPFIYDGYSKNWYDVALARAIPAELDELKPLFQYQAEKLAIGGALLNLALPNSILKSQIRVSWSTLWSINKSKDPKHVKLFEIGLAALVVSDILTENPAGLKLYSNSGRLEIIVPSEKKQLYFSSRERAEEFNADIFGLTPADVR